MAYMEKNPLWFFRIKIIIIFASTTLIFNRGLVNAATLHSEHERDNRENNECTTPICMQEAKFFQNIMKDDVDPCDDFYEFTCGKYIANTILQEGVSEALMILDVQTSIDNEVKKELINNKENDPSFLKKLKSFYNNCQENATQERVNELLQILNSVGGVPVLLGEKWNETAFDWMDTVSKLKNLGFSVNFPVNVKVEILPGNDAKGKISITLPDFEFFEPLIYVEDQEESGSQMQMEKLEKHYQHILNFAEQIGINKTVASAEMNAISLFERHLLQIHISEIKENPSAQKYFKSIKTLKNKFTTIPWLDFFKNFATGVDVNENEKIITESISSLKNLTELIEKTPKRVISNYIMMQAITDVQRHLPNEFVKRDPPQNRPSVCWETTRDYFGIALSALYIQKFVKNGTRENVLPLVHDIKNEFQEILEKSNWMDNSTKAIALEKLEAMKFNIGYTDAYFDNEKLNEYYKNFEVNNESFLKTFLSASKHIAATEVAPLRQSLAEREWTQNTHAEEINSYYLPTKNSFEIAAASLGQPLFEVTRPKYLNFGSLGSIIGHEIFHGFGNTGNQYNKNGHISAWWDSNTVTNFGAKTECFIEQYNNYFNQRYGQDFNVGFTTLEENIADNTGLKSAYYAYKHWTIRNNITEPSLPKLNYNPQQMFWISAASFYCAKYDPKSVIEKISLDPHSISDARVRISFSNLQEFAEDFNCQAGSKMNPVKKCALW